jgi:predicted PurR-regulated permease PerM
MNVPYTPDRVLETRLSRRLLDVLIRAGLVFTLVVLCYKIFSPFVGLMAWAVILAVTLYPADQKLARKLGGRQGLAATLLTLAGVVLIVLPTALLMGALGDSMHDLVAGVRDNTLVIPAPKPSVAEWRSSARRFTLHGRKPTTICRRSSRACSRSWASWPRPRSRRLPASPERY